MISDKTPTAKQFENALRGMSRPGGRVLPMLMAHHGAPGRALNAERLAEQVGYEGFRAVNLQYGLFASKLGRAMRMPEANLGLVLEFVQPNRVTNKAWILVMKPSFAEGLERAGWVGDAAQIPQ